jgi:[ribosomal protein S5]-alanine N-acetyltransferase
MQYFPSTKDRTETVEWIRAMLNRYEDDGMGFYACILKDTEEFIGYCGLVLQKDVDGSDEMEVGYGLIRRYWHHGYATEAAKACMEHAFAHLGAKSVISLIRPENIPSINVARRNQLTFVKTVFRFGYPHGVYGAKSPL